MRTDRSFPPAALRRRAFVAYRDRFLRVAFRDGVDVNITDAHELVAVTRELLAGDSLPATVDLRGVRSSSSAARAYFSSAPEAAGLSAAVGIIVGSPLSRAIGNFYLTVNRPATPTRLFSDFENADDWLAGFASRVGAPHD